MMESLRRTKAYGGLIILMLVVLVGRRSAKASDGDAMQDFCVTDQRRMGKEGGSGYGLPCKVAARVTAADFKSSVLREAGNTTATPFGIALTLASAANVGGLNTQGLSFARVDYAKGGLVPPHVHPRASEIVFVVAGTLQVGFIDSSNTLFSDTLKSGDLFVFPRGLVHFIYNVGDSKAMSVSSLNSQNPGASLVANALFGAHPSLPDSLLQIAFQLSDGQVRRLKKTFG